MPLLLEEDVDPDPHRQLERWLEGRPRDALPVALATAASGGRPSLRMVLLKSVEPHGLAFFTNYDSRKGRELAENPQAALLLYWADVGRQVRVEGPVERVAPEESDAYFAARPPASRVSAVASPQSAVLGDRRALDELVGEVRAQHGDDPPRPERWGGYRLVPETYEFWQHQDDRLHDRIRYRRDGKAWVLERLAP